MTVTPDPSMDAGIPVLTEVVDSAPSGAAPSALAAKATATAAGAAPPYKAPSPGAPAISELEWEALQRKLTERVLHGLSERIDFVLEQRVRDSLVEVMQRAVGGLADELKRALHNTMDDVVARAVAQEIAKLRAHPSLD